MKTSITDDVSAFQSIAREFGAKIARLRVGTVEADFYSDDPYAVSPPNTDTEHLDDVESLAKRLKEQEAELDTYSAG